MSNPTSVIAQARRAASTSGNPLSYPYDIGRSPYYTLLRFRKFVRNEVKEAPKENPLTSIMLPLPAELMEMYNVTYGQPSLGVMGQAIKDMGNTDGLSNDAAVQQATEAIKARMTDSNFISEAVLATFQGVVGSVTQGADAALSLVIGNAPNPHMRSIFENVPLRLFSWTWKFAPRSPDEGRAIRKIVDTIRYHSLPSAAATSGLRLNFPDELFVDFIGKNPEFMPKIRKCVVTSVALNHARAGTPTFFHDGTPTHLELSLQVQEVNQITRESF